MTYFHQSICISPQFSYPETDLEQIRESSKNLLEVIEPDYPGIPAGARRRMGKSVRMAVGAALPILNGQSAPDGIVIATANGGMEDCIKFLNQIVEYNEGLLTPANFVQSTSNAAAAQIALVTKNHNYNITHVHRGLAFENALMDVMMLLRENKEAAYLLGCTDEISAYNYNIDMLAGSFRKDPVVNTQLFDQKEYGTIPGEGAFMVWMNNNPEGAIAKLIAVKTLHTENADQVKAAMQQFISQYIGHGEKPDLLLTGENGDERLSKYYDAAESLIGESTAIARFKHYSGEYCTATSFALWLSMQILKNNRVPVRMIKRLLDATSYNRIFIYNNYRGLQHSFILLERT